MPLLFWDLWFAKMISLAKSVRISDIQIVVHRGDPMNARHVTLLHSHRGTLEEPDGVFDRHSGSDRANYTSAHN